MELKVEWPFSITSDLRPTHKLAGVKQCQQCGHLQKSITPKYLSHVENLYSNYESYASGGDDAYLASSGETAKSDRSSGILYALGNRVDLPKTGSLLDIGGGNGHFVATFMRRHPLWSATISDKSDHQIKRSLTPIRFVANLNNLTHNSYDLITLIHTLEHLPDPISSLQKVLQLLKPGG
jgi:SAM-dependent methyltransferase